MFSKVLDSCYVLIVFIQIGEYIMIRRRRLRATENLRALVRETSVSVSDLIYPLFVIEGNDIKNPIDSMPGIYQYSLDRIDEELDRIREAGVKGVLLFGIPAHKDECGTEAYNEHGIIQEAIRYIKKVFPELVVIADICLCEYTSHGHCGLIKDGIILNDETLPLLAKTAVTCAQAGADMVAPSNMMDGHIAAQKWLPDIMDHSVTQPILHQDLAIEKHTRWITIIQEKQCVTFRMTLMKEQISSLSNQHSPSWIF